MYADTDFFLAISKNSDWLKRRALEVAREYKDSIEASEAVFIELMLLAGKYKLDPMELTVDAMSLTQIKDPAFLRAAYFIKEGVGVFDAFHAAHANYEIISSDKIYDKLGLKRIKLEE